MIGVSPCKFPRRGWSCHESLTFEPQCQFPDIVPLESRPNMHAKILWSKEGCVYALYSVHGAKGQFLVIAAYCPNLNPEK